MCCSQTEGYAMTYVHIASDGRKFLLTIFGKVRQHLIGDDNGKLRLPTSHNSSVITTVASNGVRGP